MLRRPACLAVVALAFGSGVAAGDEAIDAEEPRPWLGISYQDGTFGLLITHVFEESAAMACGLPR